MRSFRAAAVVASVVGLSPCVAFAEDLPDIRLSFTGCERLSRAEIERIFEADLGVVLTESEPLEGANVAVTCSGTRIHLRCDDRVSRKQSERVIELEGESANAENRLVAIAAAELVLASWAELAVNPDPKVEPEGPPIPASKRQAARELVRDFAEQPSRPGVGRLEEEEEKPVGRAVGVVSTRQILGHGGRLWGIGLRAGVDHPGMVSWTADALFETGTIERADAPLSLTAATLAATVFFFKRWGPVTPRIGAGLRAGVTTSSVGASNSATASPWGWPLGALSVSLFPGEWVVVDLLGEAGYAVLPVAPANNSGGGAIIRGMWLSVQLGAGVTF